jgi:hypothetical protein
VSYPSATGERKAGKANKVKPRWKPRYVQRQGWETILASRVAVGKRRWRPEYFIWSREHHDPGVERPPDTGRNSQVRNAETSLRSGGSTGLR